MTSRKTPTFYVVGDIHFKFKQPREGQEFIDKLVASVEKEKPSYVVLLGDTLDSHEVSRNGPFKLAEQLLERLSAIAPVYLLIGNHDLINQRQFLTDAHFFGPFKKWKNVTVVDHPVRLTVGKMNFIFCPYVESGRLIEALDTLKDVPDDRANEFYDWRSAVCIFGHSEVSGSLIRENKWSEKGDVWDASYPIAIFGHLHTEQTVGDNVYYPGSSTQVDATESPDKRVWIVSFKKREEAYKIDIRKINLGLKWKKDLEVSLEEIKKFDVGEADKYVLRIKVKCSHEQYKAFKKSVLYTKLTARGAYITCSPIQMTSLAAMHLRSVAREQVTFHGVLDELIRRKTIEVQEAYERLKDGPQN